jgi:hypothetical protein
VDWLRPPGFVHGRSTRGIELLHATHTHGLSRAGGVWRAPLNSRPRDRAATGIRSGIHYSPPLQDVEVTAADFVRALERTKDASGGPGSSYLPLLLDGYAAFASGRSNSISGAVAVDTHTLQLRETRPDRSIVDLMAMAFSAPIPPSPTQPSAPLGLATGHPFQPTSCSHPPGRPPLTLGYGPFQVSTGPYMIEGSDKTDVTQPPAKQQPPAGFSPSWGNGYCQGPATPGHLVLVRNPSWDAATDPNRPAYPSRIEIQIQPPTNPYPKLPAGTIDTLVGEDPPIEELANYRTAAQQSRVHRSDANGTIWVALNLAQPPFDDIHVRRAFSIALNRQAAQQAVIRDQGVTTYGPVTSHIVPNSLLDNLLAGWQPRASAASAAGTVQAQGQMRQSKYWRAGKCIGAACRPVLIGGSSPYQGGLEVVAKAMRTIGLTPTIVDTSCYDPASHVVACFEGWAADYPGTSAMFPEFLDHLLANNSGLSVSALGATPSELRRAGMNVTKVPSIQSDYDRCAVALPVQAPVCWAQLDQWLTTKLVAVVPVMSTENVRLVGPNVSSFSIDQANNEVALDRVAVAH